jgi:hypothetical protein
VHVDDHFLDLSPSQLLHMSRRCGLTTVGAVRNAAARRAAAASDMMQPRHGLPQWAGGRSTKR